MPVISVEQIEVVTVIRLCRPEALNALNNDVMQALMKAFAAFEADATQRCLILTGNEQAFAAGADIKEMVGKGYAEMFGADPYAPFEFLTRIRKPWIAAVAGFALGGGCELAMMADIIIAAQNAQFGQPEIRIGISPGMGGSQRLARAIGKWKAMEMCLTGRMMDAREADMANLVTRVVPTEELLDAALETAQKISAMPPLAVCANKELVNHAFETHLSAGLLFERRTFAGLCATRDKAEGVEAFIERRKPRWSGT